MEDSFSIVRATFCCSVYRGMKAKLEVRSPGFTYPCLTLTCYVILDEPLPCCGTGSQPRINGDLGKDPACWSSFRTAPESCESRTPHFSSHCLYPFTLHLITVLTTILHPAGHINSMNFWSSFFSHCCFYPVTFHCCSLKYELV